MASRAPLVTPKPFTVTAFSIFPEAITFARGNTFIDHASSFVMQSRVTTSASTAANSCKRISAVCRASFGSKTNFWQASLNWHLTAFKSNFMETT